MGAGRDREARSPQWLVLSPRGEDCYHSRHGRMGQPNILVPVALVAFLLVVTGCFWLLGPRRTVLPALLAGWLFLPHFDGRFTFLVLHSKAAFVPAVVLLGSIVFDTGRWWSFRPRLLDLPMALLCVAPYATALHNDLGAYEGLSATLDAAMSWGAPYLLGRAYLGTSRALREFATAFVAAGLAYVPFCLWEVRMSPQLQYGLYGFRSSGFDTVVRFGGYRPDVFMQSGLAVGMFMASATLSAAWLWRTRAQEKLAGVPLAWVCVLLAATAVLCKSTGAIILLGLGFVVLEGTRRLRTPALVLVLAVTPAAYCAARISGWNAETVIGLAERAISVERASSIQFRFENEHLLIQKAMTRPWLGWGRFGRSFVYDDNGRMTVVDSMWIIVFGIGGLAALAAIGAVLALPAFLLVLTYPARHWGDPRLGSAAALAVVILLWAIDDLLNSMMSPLYPTMAGALLSFVLIVRAAGARRTRHTFEPRLTVERPSSA